MQWKRHFLFALWCIVLFFSPVAGARAFGGKNRKPKWSLLWIPSSLQWLSFSHRMSRQHFYTCNAYTVNRLIRSCDRLRMKAKTPAGKGTPEKKESRLRWSETQRATIVRWSMTLENKWRVIGEGKNNGAGNSWRGNNVRRTMAPTEQYPRGVWRLLRRSTRDEYHWSVKRHPFPLLPTASRPQVAPSCIPYHAYPPPLLKVPSHAHMFPWHFYSRLIFNIHRVWNRSGIF